MRWRQAARTHPLHLALAALVAGIVVSSIASPAIVGMAAAFLLTAAVTRSTRLALMVAALVVAGIFVGTERRHAIDGSRLDPWIGREVAARGFVARRERPAGHEKRLRVRLSSVRSMGARPVRNRELVQIRLPPAVRFPPAAIGDELALAGSLEGLPPRRDSGFDYPAYLRRAGVHAVLYAQTVTATGRRRGGFAGLVDRLRRHAEAGVGAGLPGSIAALAQGLVLGQDEQIDAGTANDFKASGLAHLLAVSGQNVTLLALLALPLLAALGFGRRARLVGVLALIAVYVPLTGAGPSILRAGAMGAAGTVAALAGRPSSRWYSLLLAAAFTLVLDPRAWLDAGWQLSFAAVLAILLLAAPMTHALARLPETIAAGVAVTFAATLATAPLMAFHFGRVPVAGLVANLIALPAVAPAMWLGMLAAAAGQLSLQAASLLNAVNGYLVAYLAGVGHACAHLPGAVWAIELHSPMELALAYVALAAVVLAIARPRLRRFVGATAASALAIAVASIALGAPAPREPYAITFLDVGQGDAILIQSPGGAVLVDSGPAGADVAGKLHDAGVRSLDLVVLTHAQADHEDGLEQVVRRFPVDLLLDGGGGSNDPMHARILAIARARGTRVVSGHAGQLLRLGELQIGVLSPPPGPVREPEPNLRALVLLVSYRGLDALLPADAESEVTLPLAPPSVELLKVAHHGSEDEGLPSLLKRLEPLVAVIEVGAHNRYGHPHPHTLAALHARVRRVLRTDRDGDVRVSLGAHGMVVETGR
jgi:competence protein ComEC